MIFVSLLTCLLGIGLYVFDLLTDIKFSFEIFHETSKNDHSNELDFGIFLSENGDKVSSCKSYSEDCCEALHTKFQEMNNLTASVNVEDEFYTEESYKLLGFFAGWHCVLPFFTSIIVFIIMKCRRGGNCSAPVLPKHFQKKKWWCLFSNSVLCCLPILAYTGSVLPIPLLTYVYRFYLDVRSHNARSHPDFRTQIVKYEQKIRKHESVGKLSNDL